MTGRRVLVLNGPNLGRLGKREPAVYGTATHADLADLCISAGQQLGLDVEVRQTEYEGELVERAINVKAAVVAADLRESGLRETLNYGHTLAHAIEKLERYRFRHGDAVAIGMVFAAEVGHLAGYLSAADVTLHKQLLTEVGLPVAYPRAVWPELRATMSLDKKTRGARLRMVILDGVGSPIIYDNPPEDLLAQAYQAVAA